MSAVPARKSFKVTVGNSHLTCYPYKTGWRFAWRETFEADWQYVTALRAAKDEFKQVAENKLRELDRGGLQFSTLPPERREWLHQLHKLATPGDQQPLLDYLQNRKKSATLADGVARFLAFKTPAGKDPTPHNEQIARDLLALVDHFPAGTLITDILLPQLETFWNTRTGTAADARRKAIRGTLVQFWKWARKDGIAGNDVDTLPQRLPVIDAPEGSLHIFYPAELEYLLALVGKEWLPLVILGAFQGIRPEELAPKKDSPKPGLKWEHIDWQWNTITVPKEVAKTRKKKGTRARKMPLHPVTRAWLEALGAGPHWRGRICLRNPTEVYQRKDRLTAAWGNELTKQFPARFPDGWPPDALRHSYASYRIAILQNAGQVALEMGNSEDMLHGHYNSPRTDREGNAWFDLHPAKVANLPPYLDLSRIGPKSDFNPLGSQKTKSTA